MNKNTLLLMFGLCITLFLLGGKPAFAEVYQNKGGIVSNPVYDAGADEYTAKFDRFKVKKIIHRTYSDSTYSTIGFDGVINIESPYDVTGRQYWTCISYFEDIYYDASGNELGSLRFHASEIKEKKCNSNIADNATDPDSAEACVNAICKCIQELNDTAKEINQSVNTQGGKITDAVNSNGQTINETLKKINVDTTAIKDELTTSDDIMTPDNPVADVPTVPGVKLEADPDVFEDDTIYFKDNGDAETPGKMPDAPDIAECWDKTGDTVCKDEQSKAEDKLEKDESLKKDDENKKDTEIEKDDALLKDEEIKKNDPLKKDEDMKKDESLNKDEEMKKDAMLQDDQMKQDAFTKDEQMNKDSFSKDEQMNKDSFNKDEQFDKSPELDKGSIYSKTPN